ncbi:hypothetical protein SAMN05216439_1576 [Methanobrevibacter gottschalkii]|uniref:Uncharacterized protein n=2 Tax=Methanobrevibacter gottschalkii TaxID=190974 RepID=A0A3N5BL87_9EURY|nr:MULTISPECIES: hypothetical protein [Methanobrevibacter]MCQ2971668.1 hypothetical protein [archaeon]OEC96795.1 hypothetical protein A9505_06590 [Methanobrevibacter sp. A27]RPF50448.1 hypothetical protein EDC42_1726 [Methanobrevibacter gottschalkii DSM 11977]SEK85923.1 hypothetical protein SAMN05216439_1576 [Methanobrevibacter gottschalkii]
MFNSKFLILIIGVLIIGLALSCYFYSSDNFHESDSSLNERHDDVVYLWMLDDNGKLKLVPTTETYSEGSASDPD